MLKKIVTNSWAQLIGKAFSVTASLAATVLITRKLGVTDYGQYVFLVAFINLMAAFGNWGTQIIGIREIAKSKNKGVVFGSLFNLRLALGMVAILIGLVVTLSFKTFSDIRLLALISLPLILAIILESTFEIVFQAFVKMEIKTKINLVSSIIFLAVTYLLLKLEFGLLAPMAGWAAARTFSILASVSPAKRLIKEKIRTDQKIVCQLIKESLPMGALLILFSVYDQAIDSLIIKTYLGPTQVGLYGLAYKIYANLVLPAYFLSNSIFPILSKNPKKELFKLLKIGFGLSGMVLALVIPGILLFNQGIVSLIAGAEFSGSSLILKILSLALIFSYFNHLSGFSLIALNRQRDSLKIGVIALVWNLVLNISFVPRGGVIAAAWITVSTEALVAMLSFYRLMASRPKN